MTITAPLRQTPPLARYQIKRAAVLGAGTMGSQIAGLLASQGIPCDLLDLSTNGHDSRRAEEARQKLLRLQPPPLYSSDALAFIHPGNFEDHLSRLQQVDWVIEAVVEDLEAKRRLWTRVAEHVRPDAVLSSNTSGIPIASIGEALPPHLRPHFLGTHFFNPPRYLRLLEVIPTQDTEDQALQAIRWFAEEVLGKGVVIAKDTPGFIGTRLGVYGLMAVLHLMEELGLEPDDMDSVTGPAMARSTAGTFRTADLVGLDVLVAICDHLREVTSDPLERRAFDVPPYLREMVKRGWTGEKAGQGFYKRTTSGGESQVLTLQPATLEYRPRRRMAAPSLAAVRDMDDPAQKLRTLVNADDPAGRFAWRALSSFLAYTAGKVGEVAPDVVSVDRAMRWGFNWELGPFEAWDALGVAGAVSRMRKDGLSLPEWVVRLAEREGSFYQDEPGGRLLQATHAGALAPVEADSRAITHRQLRTAHPVMAKNPGATLLDLGDDVAFLDFHSPRQAIGPDMIAMLEEAARIAPQQSRALVIGSHVQPNFCVGANLMMLLLTAQEGDWQELDGIARRFQQALLAIKRMPVPVVAAPYGQTLGGGAEIALAASRVTAAAESYVGLVEVGAGIIPAGGGCKEMLLRALDALPGGIQALLGRPAGGAPQLLPQLDPTPALAGVFEAIGTARVSGSGQEARRIGFLRPADVIIPNVDHLLYVAKATALAMCAQGYRPQPQARLPILGANARAILELAAQTMLWAGQATEHDVKIARKLAYVLTGGDRPAGSVANEEYFLDLEREAFLSLCGEPKTQARMQAVLQTGRPLRN